jgi:hypothetical protein
MPTGPRNLDRQERDRLSQIRKNQAALQLLRYWSEHGNEEEQRETLDHLRKTIDENRPGQRKHFS